MILFVIFTCVSGNSIIKTLSIDGIFGKEFFFKKSENK